MDKGKQIGRRTALTMIGGLVPAHAVASTIGLQDRGAAPSPAPRGPVITRSAAGGFKDALQLGRALNMPLADSATVADAYQRARDESKPWLFNHVARSWFYGIRLAEANKLKPDAELVAVSVLLHDLGLARGAEPDRRFAVVGADLGREFAVAHQMGDRRAETVWDSIAFHTTSSIARFKGVDVTCCSLGIGCDFGGRGAQLLTDDDKAKILSAYPRLQMKREMTACLAGIARDRPETARDNFVGEFGKRYVPGFVPISYVDGLQNAPFAE